MFNEDQAARMLGRRRMLTADSGAGEMMDINFRQLLLWGAIAAGVAHVFWADVLDQAIQPAYSELAMAAPEQIAADKRSSQIRDWRDMLESRRFSSETGGDAFSDMTWELPKKRAPAAEVRKVPVVPASPVFPYTYMGKMLPEGGSMILFLTLGASVYVLHEGDLVDGAFRIEAIGVDGVEVVHVATQSRIAKRYDDMAASTRTGQRIDATGPVMALAPGPFRAADGQQTARVDERREPENRPESTPAAAGMFSGVRRPLAADGSAESSAPAQPAPASAVAAGMPASTLAEPGPMQMLQPGKPMAATNQSANTVPHEAQGIAYPKEIVSPRGADR